MSTQVVIVTTTGRTIQGVSHRMASYTVPTPSVPASPAPFQGGMYHIQTPMGWEDVPAHQVHSISIRSSGGAL